MNEFNQIVSFKFVAGKGADEVIPILQGIKRRYELQVCLLEWLPSMMSDCFWQNWALPEVVYTDNCCADRPAITQVFPRAQVFVFSLSTCANADCITFSCRLSKISFMFSSGF